MNQFSDASVHDQTSYNVAITTKAQENSLLIIWYVLYLNRAMVDIFFVCSYLWYRILSSVMYINTQTTLLKKVGGNLCIQKWQYILVMWLYNIVEVKYTSNHITVSSQIVFR